MNDNNLQETQELAPHHGHRLLYVLVGVIAIAVVVGAIVFHRNHQLPITEDVRIYIPSGSSYEDVLDTLEVHHCLADKAAFSLMARIYHYPDHVKPGSYVLKPEMSSLRLMRKLNGGAQDPIRLTINKQRTPQLLCDYLDTKLELCSADLLQFMQSDSVCSSHGFTPQTILCLFLQNTYEVYWTISPEQLLQRMHKEYDRFWSPVRQGECKDLQLTPVEVITLASIVEEETNKNDEKARVASVYLNRLHKGMLLQADPTVKYAVGNFALQRILNKHLAVDNPYNTYLYKGLPPGPICIPSTSSIEAVLANLHTNYLYFCAREDFSGYHNFASTLAEHQRNANRFHQALNKKGI